MPAAASFATVVLDIPTLSLVAVCISALLGLLLLLAWLQQRNVMALAWWGAAYILGAAAMAMWRAPGVLSAWPDELPTALIFIACGMIWSGVRLFHGRALRPVAAFAAAPIWLAMSAWPLWPDSGHLRNTLGAIAVAGYTFAIAFELWRERRKSFYSRAAAILVPCLHAAMFLLPLAMRLFRPDLFAANWMAVFTLETVIYGVGAAFIVLTMAKDFHVHQYRTAATTDHLTGLANRRAFLEAAAQMQTDQGKRGAAVTLLMFDLDYFKSVNDRFGHATGDSVLKVFAQVAQSSMRATDVVGRLGGEEFAAIVPEAMEDAVQIAERLRTTFEVAGLAVNEIAVGATVSIGLATSYQAQPNIDALILRADEALYKAKHGGRNRYCCAEEEAGPRPVPVKPARGWAARRRKVAEAAVTG